MNMNIFRISCFAAALILLASIPALAESIKGVKLGDPVKTAIAAFGKPASEKSIPGGGKKYVWGRKNDTIVVAHSKADVITYLHCNTSIRCTAENKAYCTEKGVGIGAHVSTVVKKYGRGAMDYAYPSEDCSVQNFKISPKEMLIIRSYGFNPRGGIVIDIVLCDPSFPSADIWKETREL